jgi:hypothetical protein
MKKAVMVSGAIVLYGVLFYMQLFKRQDPKAPIAEVWFGTMIRTNVYKCRYEGEVAYEIEMICDFADFVPPNGQPKTVNMNTKGGKFQRTKVWFYKDEKLNPAVPLTGSFWYCQQRSDLVCASAD